MTHNRTTPPAPEVMTRMTVGGLAYDISGSGDPVLLIHGYPLDRSAMDEVAAGLATTHTVINPDLRGFGASRAAVDGDLSMERHADDLAELLDAEAFEAATVIGLSMGGYVALAFAERYPTRVTALGLIGSKTEPDTEDGRRARDTQAAQILEHGRTSIIQGMQGALLAEGAPAMVRARLRTMIESTRYETYLAALAAMRDRPDRSHVLASLEIPVAVVVGEHDLLVPADTARAVAGLGRTSTLTVVPGAGHLVTMEDPPAVIAGLAAILGS